MLFRHPTHMYGSVLMYKLYPNVSIWWTQNSRPWFPWESGRKTDWTVWSHIASSKLLVNFQLLNRRAGWHVFMVFSLIHWKWNNDSMAHKPRLLIIPWFCNQIFYFLWTQYLDNCLYFSNLISYLLNKPNFN